METETLTYDTCIFDVKLKGYSPSALAYTALMSSFASLTAFLWSLTEYILFLKITMYDAALWYHKMFSLLSSGRDMLIRHFYRVILSSSAAVSSQANCD